MLTLIAAVAQQRAIGKNNTLPWHLPEDLRHFRKTTSGKAVIMGRKTWESLPAAFRPLPGRLNIVVTRDAHYAATGATVAHSLAEAAAAVPAGEEAFVIGGAELYGQALPLAQRLVLTEIDLAVADADAFFPAFAASDWREVSRDEQVSAAEPTLHFAFVVYERI
jgi:dihydrofolate reductase